MTIAWYMHHHGAGHRRRFEQISHRMRHPVVGISQIEIGDGVRLPSDHAGLVSADDVLDATARGRLHHAPLDPRVTGAFHLRLTEALLRIEPAVVLVDVSVEVALTARLCGLPVAIVRQLGDRSDPGHRLAYDIADFFIAPYPAAVEDPTIDDATLARTHHVGYLSGRGADPATVDSVDESRRADRPGGDDVVVIASGGDASRLHSRLTAIAASLSSQGRRVHVAGFVDGHESNVIDHGLVSSIASLLIERPTVIANAGNNLIGDVVTAGCPFVIVPEARPFGEQAMHAGHLDDIGAAVCITPHDVAPDWDRAVHTARERVDVLRALATPNAAADAADLLDAVASQQPVHRDGSDTITTDPATTS